MGRLAISMLPLNVMGKPQSTGCCGSVHSRRGLTRFELIGRRPARLGCQFSEERMFAFAKIVLAAALAVGCPIAGTSAQSQSARHGEGSFKNTFAVSDAPIEAGDLAPIFTVLTGPSRYDKDSYKFARRQPPFPPTLNVSTTRTQPLAQERCGEAPVDVASASSDERNLACSAAGDAIHLLSRCKIYLRTPLRVEITKEVLHPISKVALGFFDAKRQKIFVAQIANVPSLIRGTPYGELPPRDFYKSLIVHEVVHAIMHQNYERQPMTRAAHEYPAYALQIESLPAEVRETFLRSMNAGADALLFNDMVLAADPFYFAARAYEHFRASANQCAQLIALLEGEVAFIPTLPELSP